MTDNAPTRIFLSPPHMTGAEEQCVAEAFRSNYVAPIGPMLDRFETMLGDVTGQPHVAALSSGTAAMHLALRLAGVGPGDEVWGPTLTFIGGVSPIVYEGATPVFFDCDRYGLIDLDLVDSELDAAASAGRLPKALIVTDLYGLVPDMARARRLADRHGITLIADAAESLGSTRDGRPAGQGADFVILSFNGNKIITTSGGGALASADEEAMRMARKLATQAREPVTHYEHEIIGYNYRLSNISAAIGCGQLEDLDIRVEKRRAIFSAYARRLERLDGVAMLDEPGGCVSNRWLSVMFVAPGDGRPVPADLIGALEAEDIEARPVWKPMHRQPVFADARFVGADRANALFAAGLCLPSGTAMDNADIDRISTIVETVFGSGGH